MIPVQRDRTPEQPLHLTPEENDPNEANASPGQFQRLLVSAREVMATMKSAFGQLKLHTGRRTQRHMQPGVGRRAQTYLSESRGRPVRHAPFRTQISNMALLPSITASMLRQGVQTPFRLSRNDLREWVRQGKAPLHIILIVDASASTFHFIEPTAKIISVLYRDAYRNRDKLGLVAIQNSVPQIIHHPSRNLRVVLGHLTRLEPSGHTPLAGAMELALNVFRQEKRRDPALNPLAILLSDCHPEPVDSPDDGNLMAAQPYQDVLHNARLFRQAKIPIVVINPAHGTFKNGHRWWGTDLATRISTLSGGQYYGIPHNRYEKDPGMVQQAFERRDLHTDTQAIAHLLRDFRDRPSDIMTPPGRVT